MHRSLYSQVLMVVETPSVLSHWLRISNIRHRLQQPLRGTCGMSLYLQTQLHNATDFKIIVDDNWSHSLWCSNFWILCASGYGQYRKLDVIFSKETYYNLSIRNYSTRNIINIIPYQSIFLTSPTYQCKTLVSKHVSKLFLLEYFRCKDSSKYYNLVHLPFVYTNDTKWPVGSQIFPSYSDVYFRISLHSPKNWLI
jgi:hypothetical protein